MWHLTLRFPSVVLCFLVARWILQADGLAAAQRDGDQVTPQVDFDDVYRQYAVIEKRLAEQQVVGVRKMSADEGEKFLLDYWIFDNGSEKPSPWCNVDFEGGSNEIEECNNASRSAEVRAASLSAPRFRPPFSLHTDERVELFHPAGRQLRGILSLRAKRDFECPNGTFSCSLINRPGSCCGNGDNCILVSNTSLGDVGCCPQGETCAGVIGPCESGYKGCPASLGGGCCIPGYECVTSGCKIVEIHA
jgi:progranulin